MEPSSRADAPPCFNAIVTENSATTKAVFDQRKLQSGGPTWMGLLLVLARRHAKITGPLEGEPGPMGFGMVYEARSRRGKTWIVVDDEGDAAILCTGDPALLAAVRHDHARLNADPKELETALDQVAPEDVE